MSKPSHPSIRIAVVGGGAAGIFAALTAAETNPNARIVVFEKSPRFLSKVKISGGGRCNVTHSCFDPKELISRYPRGSKALLGPFHRWQPRDMIDWLEMRGVALKTERDGRMFPTTDSSQTIIDCLLDAASVSKIELRSRAGVSSVTVDSEGRFILSPHSGPAESYDRLIIASGGGKSLEAHALATSLGHNIAPLAPSLFTFHVEDPRIEGLQGLVVPNATIACPQARLKQSGPLLITHWGLSGPAALKLSAWGARAFASCDYRFEVAVNWTGRLDRQAATDALEQAKGAKGAKLVNSDTPFDLPKRLWVRLVRCADISDRTPYSQLSKANLQTLAIILVDSRFHVSGKSMNKEEFVTCGGVELKEVDFKRMESKLRPGLHFAGEALDIDGVTGGFNFQAAWTTGRIAGLSAAEPKSEP